MAFNPQCSWTVTYNPDVEFVNEGPSTKNYNNKGYNYYTGGISAQKSYGSASNANPMQVRRNKSNYSWNFNKGIPCKFGAKCRFIERCKYCDSPTHGVNSCHKLQKKEGAKNVMANATVNNAKSNHGGGASNGAAASK